MTAAVSVPRRRLLRAAGAWATARPAMLAAGAWAVTPAARAAAPRPLLRLAGPWASVSLPLLALADAGGLPGVAERVEFAAWNHPDELRLLALEGRADVLAVPANVAANLYNRGVPLKLLNVSTWGILWIVSRRGALDSLAALRGQEIALPFRGDMPDIVFQLLAREQGLDPRRDFRLNYVASPLDAMQLLLARRIDHALLAEPAASMALHKTRSFPLSAVAPELHRGLDLQREWGRVFGRAPRMPQAGIAVLGALRDDATALARVHAAYADALARCQAAAAACGARMAARNDRLAPQAVADSLAASALRAVPAAQARDELEFFYRHLHDANPALIGGRLPDAGFYATA